MTVFAFRSSIMLRAPAFGIRSFSTTSTSGVSQSMPLRSRSPVLQRLKTIFEEYRKENYSYETPARFRKEIIKAALQVEVKEAQNIQNSSVQHMDKVQNRNSDADAMIGIERINQILVNIGGADNRLSDVELDEIMI
eukprot:CAMPEP_0172509036 /NCGR_PEP_ID=MMETSP1066-20121228/217082_1 /TAXON_ID=671091 /ORGANISM="Coscinodiscus wailesii, Strain CCMP2513" /LENGTH=136 /DNA_ID=CAMNT_0013287339 /DNA_START=216 /DNA_END=626 /DNA_ORIENTATION=-